MSDTADRLCKRCGKPFYSTERIEGEDHVMIHFNEFCPDCRRYRNKELKSAVERATRTVESEIESETCPQCHGRGTLSGGGVTKKCSKCGGEGRIKDTAKELYSFCGRGLHMFSGKDDKDYLLRGYTPRTRREIERELPNDFSKDNSLCFLTTACTVSVGLPDDCLELQTLRSFRDNVLMRTAEGQKDVEEYYSIAPRIVREIDSREDALQIYSDIYKNDIRQAVAMIFRGSFNQAYEHYKAMVARLKKRVLGR